MDLEKKAIRVACLSSLIVGIAITMVTWGFLHFDWHQLMPISTLVVLCYVLTAVQALGPTPNCELEFLCGPRQVFVPAIAVGWTWLASKCGVDYSAFGKLVNLDNLSESYLGLGIVGGYIGCQVYVAASVWVNGGRGSSWS
jgi:hypothetical protein